MTAKKCQAEQLSLEVTVLSAHSLKNSSIFYRLRPYVVLSSSASASTVDGLLRTMVDEKGGASPTWGDTLRVPVGPAFLRPGGDEGGAAVHVSVLSRRRLAGPARLGWCRIPPSDVLDGLRPPTARRRLSYALRSPRHGGRGHGVVHLAVRLVGPGLDQAGAPAVIPAAPVHGWCRVAIGIPVAAPAAAFPAPARREVKEGTWGWGTDVRR